MSLYHGTSARVALKILKGELTKPSVDGYLYCFPSGAPEALAGAMAFATCNGERNGSVEALNSLEAYIALNPHFPTGLTGAYARRMLDGAASIWIKKQMLNATDAEDLSGAIVEYEDTDTGIEIFGRSGWINEIKVGGHDLPQLSIRRVYIDDSLMNEAIVQDAIAAGIDVQPLSKAVDMLKSQLSALQVEASPDSDQQDPPASPPPAP